MYNNKKIIAVLTFFPNQPLKKGLISLSFFLFLFPFVYGQSGQNESRYYNWFDQTIGIENTDLYNGVEYIPRYRVVHDKHQFFISSDFINGSLVYNGQLFTDVDFKYDIFSDEILLKVEEGFGKGTIKTIKDKVEGFIIGDQKFVKIKSTDENPDANGFYEVLLEMDALSLFKKHVLKTAKLKDEGRFYYEFIKGKDTYCLLFNDINYEINNVRDLTDIFPKYKKEINKYYDGTLRKSGRDSSFQTLVRRIHQLYSNEEPNRQK